LQAYTMEQLQGQTRRDDHYQNSKCSKIKKNL